MIEVDEGVRRPESAAKFFSCNYLTRTLDQHAQDLERLLLQLHLLSPPAQLPGLQIYLEHAEADNSA